MKLKNILRLLLGSLLVIFVLITAISLFFPSRVRISRAINVLAAAEQVREPIRDMRQWTSWNPLLDSVEQDQIRFLPNEESIPEKLELNNVKVSWLAVSDSLLLASFSTDAGRPVTNGWQIITHPGTDSTTIQWYMDFRLRWYPWEKFSSLLLEKSYGSQLEVGLVRLRQTIYANRSSQ
ncbi:MAG: SRPBCC family protein [Chitinophagaceae bacterium]